jgi:hypothetical protein
MNRLKIFLWLICCTAFVHGQNDVNKLQWSSTRKLTVDYFQIKTKIGETTLSFAQFSIEYQVGGLNFLTKNFNKKVQNYMIPSASWIDTTSNVNRSLMYQQTLFDMAEIYTRQFRKALKENRKKIISGVDFVSDLNNQILSNFAKRRVDYDKETNFGENADAQQQWEIQIQKELEELKDFAYEK